ncbi:serine hydrolase [Neobacillus mesonae]|uniref:serine hydrolase n=1 Tax=Neobacillus mesonae TaxID=1193713 RepID=UPI002573E211|nr:serine hydrolase [Neobacillus mesonae]MED4205183.1 class A beta-lactamase-related serine hydrolase [Neobacillus mesonae]
MLKIKKEIMTVLAGLKGKAGVAIEIDNQFFYYHNEEVFPSASVIKVPILIEGLKQAENGIITLNDMLTIRERVGGSGVLQALSDQSSMSVKDLLTLMITVSDNTATNMIIDLLGLDSINKTMETLGLQKTALQRKMMDIAAVKRGLNNITCASDLIICLKVINEGESLSEESRTLALTMMNYQQFHDKLTARVDPDKVFVASKTGSLPGVENDCAIFKYRGRTAYAAILTEKLEDEYSGRQVISQIGKYLYDYLTEMN